MVDGHWTVHDAGGVTADATKCTDYWATNDSTPKALEPFARDLMSPSHATMFAKLARRHPDSADEINAWLVAHGWERVGIESLNDDGGRET